MRYFSFTRFSENFAAYDSDVFVILFNFKALDII